MGLPNLLVTGAIGIQYLEQKLKSMTLNDHPKVYLRRPHKAHNSYDFWEAEASEAGLSINLGIEGANGRNFFRGTPECTGQDPIKELLDRASSKVREGYTLVREQSNLA